MPQRCTISLAKSTGVCIHLASFTQLLLQSRDVEKEDKVKRTADYLNSIEMKLYHYHFLSFILAPLDVFNTTFQVGCFFISPC